MGEATQYEVGPNYILVQRNVPDASVNTSSTCFSHPEQSYVKEEVEVIEDGTQRYQSGDRLVVHIQGPDVWDERQSAGDDWTKKFVKAEDVVYKVCRANKHAPEGSV